MKHLIAAAAAGLVLALAPTIAHADTTTRAEGIAGPIHCDPEPRRGIAWSKSGPNTYARTNVWTYGDSITYQSRNHLKAAFRTAVDAHWGRNAKAAVDALDTDLRAHRAPAIVVMAVGTNDLQNIPELRRQVVRARKMLPRKTRLLWVNVYVDTSGKFYAANRAIKSVRGVKPLSWTRVNREKMRDGRSLLLNDGIHVNSLGCRKRTELIRKAVDRVSRRDMRERG